MLPSGFEGNLKCVVISFFCVLTFGSLAQAEYICEASIPKGVGDLVYTNARCPIGSRQEEVSCSCNITGMHTNYLNVECTNSRTGESLKNWTEMSDTDPTYPIQCVMH